MFSFEEEVQKFLSTSDWYSFYLNQKTGSYVLSIKKDKEVCFRHSFIGLTMRAYKYIFDKYGFKDDCQEISIDELITHEHSVVKNILKIHEKFEQQEVDIMDLEEFKGLKELINRKVLLYSCDFSKKNNYYIWSIANYSVIFGDYLGWIIYKYNKDFGYKAITIDNLPSDMQDVLKEIIKIKG